MESFLDIGVLCDDLDFLPLDVWMEERGAHILGKMACEADEVIEKYRCGKYRLKE